MRKPAAAAAVAAALLSACTRGGDAPAAGGAPPGDPPPPAGTPVSVAVVRRATLAVRVTGPGSTVALDLQKVRAPFAGTLSDLPVQDGDRVAAGQLLGHVLSRESAAALEGARAMAREARTPAEREDAARALALAGRSRVEAALRAPAAGVVVSHQASAGTLVARGQEVLAVAAAGSISFVARLVQSDLPRVRSGQPAEVEIPALRATVPGVVHSILASGDAAAFDVPVRIDLRKPPRGVGLFGTARVTVEERAGVPVVPAAAVLRDDVSGTSRLATVTPEGKARWIEVRTGAEQGGEVELLPPAPAEGERVITAGMVGLPEGAPVEVRP